MVKWLHPLRSIRQEGWDNGYLAGAEAARHKVSVIHIDNWAGADIVVNKDAPIHVMRVDSFSLDCNNQYVYMDITVEGA